ncbi:MAG TPA: RNA 2',3'-cyclic phosphodiesterase [Clostridiales bacterium]|nr:RNA 2',3'-cyclic phosphodiesterase [Clostridiales bacterium]
MRLFTAVTFDEDIRDSLYEVINMLRPLTVKGSFTLKENLHLTLNFIGETSDVDSVRKAMEQAVLSTGMENFNITISGFGRFKSRDGDICWLGVKREERLWRLQRELSDQLRAVGFVLEKRDYTPHLTLARRVHFAKGFDVSEISRNIPVLMQKVGKVSLMKSERINGKLTYTEVYSAALE